MTIFWWRRTYNKDNEIALSISLFIRSKRKKLYLWVRKYAGGLHAPRSTPLLEGKRDGGALSQLSHTQLSGEFLVKFSCRSAETSENHAKCSWFLAVIIKKPLEDRGCLHRGKYEGVGEIWGVVWKSRSKRMDGWSSTYVELVPKDCTFCSLLICLKMCTDVGIFRPFFLCFFYWPLKIKPDGK